MIADEENFRLARKYLKYKILCDDITWRGSNNARQRVSDLIRRTIKNGEAHSALIIGPRGCGKSTLISSVLDELDRDMCLNDDAVVIRLNGLLHRDEKQALQAITSQMQLETPVSAVQKLEVVLTNLGTAKRSMIILLEEFQAFCNAPLAQTMLYNLFDLTHSAKVPICVLGITSRLDVMELLEKRVKSRFSHNHIFVFPNECRDSGEKISHLEYFKSLFVELLSLPYDFAPTKVNTPKKNTKKFRSPSTKYALPQRVIDKCGLDLKQFAGIDKEFIKEWNEHIEMLARDEKVVDAIEKFCYYSVNEQIFRDVLFQLSCDIPFDNNSVSACIDNSVVPESRLEHIQSLSVLQLSLLIAMFHSSEALNGQPINFDMLLHRYTKFVSLNSSAQTVPRPVILKAFEHLRSLELVAPAGAAQGLAGAARVQKEYQFYSLAVSRADLHEAVRGFKALPTEIMHWLNNSIV